MSRVRSSHRKSARNVRHALGEVWADIVQGQRRAAEVNTPWAARRRSGEQL